jgi:hypothetical protein
MMFRQHKFCPASCRKRGQIRTAGGHMSRLWDTRNPKYAAGRIIRHKSRYTFTVHFNVEGRRRGVEVHCTCKERGSEALPKRVRVGDCVGISKSDGIICRDIDVLRIHLWQRQLLCHALQLQRTDCRWTRRVSNTFSFCRPLHVLTTQSKQRKLLHVHRLRNDIEVCLYAPVML